MNDDADGLAGSLRELASEARRRGGPDAHPSPETLTAYHAGELAPAAEEEVQEHLAVCRHCARLLLDLPGFLETPAAAADAGRERVDAADAEDDASWQAIRARLPWPPEPAEGRRQAPPRAWRNVSRRTLARLAAAVLLGLVAVPLWIIARQLSAPALPATVVELSPAEGARGTSEPAAPPPVTVHAAAAATTLLVHLAREQPELRFRVELHAAGPLGAAAAGRGGAGTATEVLPVATVVDSRTLLLLLARRQLAPGLYELRVVDPASAAAEPLGDYPLQVVEP